MFHFVALPVTLVEINCSISVSGNRCALLDPLSNEALALVKLWEDG